MGEVFVGIIIVIAANGEVNAGVTGKELGLDECRERVTEQVERLKDQFERVAGFCRQMPPKPVKTPAPSKPSEGMTL